MLMAWMPPNIQYWPGEENNEPVPFHVCLYSCHDCPLPPPHTIYTVMGLWVFVVAINLIQLHMHVLYE